MPAPEDANQRVLYRDLERHITVADTTGWGVDRTEIDAMLEAALDSTCRVDPLDRRALATWLDAEITRRGGPVEVAWRTRGKKLSAVADLLEITRIRLLLQRAEEASLDCPFWIEPEEPFLGRQVSERRWQLSVGYGGKGIIVAQGDRENLNFGGAGRLLFGRTFAEGNGVYAGLEIGASAAFPDDPNAGGGLEFGIDVVTPLLYRHTLTNTFFELDAGWLGRTTEDGLVGVRPRRARRVRRRCARVAPQLPVPGGRARHLVGAHVQRRRRSHDDQVRVSRCDRYRSLTVRRDGTRTIRWPGEWPVRVNVALR